MAYNPYNEKQKEFVRVYMDSLDEDCFGNGTKAAIKAGYSAKTAANQASRLLTKAHIKNAIANKRFKRLKKYEHSREVSLQNLEEIIVLAKAQGNTASMVAAEREKNAITGLHVQIILQDADQQRQLDDKEKTEAVKIARIRLQEGNQTKTA